MLLGGDMTQATSTIEVDGSFTDELDAFFGHRWDGNPYDLYARVRAHGPAMPWRESVLVSRHEDVKAVYKDNARFLNGPVASGAPRMQRIRALMSDHQLQLFDRILDAFDRTLEMEDGLLRATAPEHRPRAHAQPRPE